MQNGSLKWFVLKMRDVCANFAGIVVICYVSYFVRTLITEEQTFQVYNNAQM